MNCPKCGKTANKNGSTKSGKQKYICRHCKHNFERPKEEELIEISEPTEQAIGLTEAQRPMRFRKKVNNEWVEVVRNVI